ncbi:MAG: AAA family ATPase, partial [Proteobacteria bacterium]|nr:AAA family ATPase [Pseudomonadota bacterium]
PSVSKILGAKDVFAFQDLVRRVPVAENVIQFAVTLANRTRPQSVLAPQSTKTWIRWGAGPRASQYLILGSKARAILDGRSTPEIADVRAMAGPVLRHRIVPSFTAEAEGISAIQIVQRLVEEMP